jgi:serine/threonine protein kinase
MSTNGALAADRYLLAQRLGAGAAGTDVHAAIDLERGVVVALKLPPGDAAPDAAKLLEQRVAREARLGQALADCPGVVRWLDHGTFEDGRPFVVHDLVLDPKPLDLVTGTLDERLARLEAAATCVAALHGRGVAHRDLSPERFVVDASGEVRLTELGGARWLQGGGDDAPLCRPADAGAAYRSLEQLRDGRAADARADVYALGVMLYLALTGKLPREGDTGVVLSQLLHAAHARGGEVRPSDVMEGVPPALDALCAKSLRAQAARRLGSAGAFLDELHRVRVELQAKAPDLTPRPQTVAPVESFERTVGIDKVGALPGGYANSRLALTATSIPQVEDATVKKGTPLPDVQAPSLLTSLVGRPVTIADRAGVEAAWTVVEPLGRGATGEAWLLRTPGANGEAREAALKVSLEQGDLGFEIERRILEQLDHPNVIGLVGRGPRGSLAVERAFPNPLTLFEAVSTGPRPTRYPPLPPGVALELGYDLLRGIAYLHSLSFCHHDVKPANFLIVPTAPIASAASGRAMVGPPTPAQLLEGVARSRFRGVLIDLGGARSFAWLDDLNQGRDTGDLVLPQLTPLLAPPEVLVPRSTPTGMQNLLVPSHDLYAAGLTIYMMLTGHVPYDHEDALLQPFSALLELKGLEQSGDMRPISRRALDEMPLDDVRFVSADPAARTQFVAAMWDLLTSLTGPLEKRPTAAQAVRAFAELSHMRGGDADPRPRQGVFSMDFAQNRLTRI